MTWRQGARIRFLNRFTEGEEPFLFYPDYVKNRFLGTGYVHSLMDGGVKVWSSCGFVLLAMENSQNPPIASRVAAIPRVVHETISCCINVQRCPQRNVGFDVRRFLFRDLP